jgi:ribose transport system ATP-binding protein
MSENTIVVREISKRFGETVALNKCSLTIQPGAVHAVVGENGSGKSTLAKILSGVLTPDGGTFSIFGGTPATPIDARRLGVATIFQEILVAESLSVLDNLFVGADSLWRRRHTKVEAQTLGQDMLTRLVGQDVDLDAPVGLLPLSIKQWIVIARALLSKPRLLILDESSAALDLDATARLHGEIRKLRSEGCCIVIVTHRIAELIRITDRATVLRDGSVVGGLSGEEITEENLLGLMSPNRPILTEPKQEAPAPRRITGEVVVVAREVSIIVGGKPFTFELKKGEIVGVTGLDGQGHTSFVRVIAGLLSAIHGEVLVRQAGAERLMRGISDAESGGVTFVSGDRAKEGIFPNLSIFENFALAMYKSRTGALGWIDWQALAGLFRSEVKRLRIKTGPWSNRITSLSGGNQQKVLIGRAFALEPEVIVLDDPARGVDAGTKRELYAELTAFAQAGGAVVYLSSEIEEFFGFADRVLVFRDGTLYETVTSKEISEHAILGAMFGQSKETELDYEVGGEQ